MTRFFGIGSVILANVFEKIEDVFSVQPKRKRETPRKKCSLPGCENMTSHRGWYCCAEHKNMHKRTALVDVL